MTMPGFTAQASLGHASRTYYPSMRSISPYGSIQPALSFSNMILRGRPYRLCLQERCVEIAPDSYYCYCSEWVYLR